MAYDPTREFSAAFNPLLAQAWKTQTGRTLQVRACHGGSGSQARPVIDGLEADVVTLALEPDIDAISERGGLIAPGRRNRLSNRASPYTSTILFVVRRGSRALAEAQELAGRNYYRPADPAVLARHAALVASFTASIVRSRRHSVSSVLKDSLAICAPFRVET